MLLDIPSSARLLATQLEDILKATSSIPGRVHELLIGSISLSRQPIEYKIFLRLLNLSDYSPKVKEAILNQDIICYNVGGADATHRTNLIVYTVDAHNRVTRWGCYYKGEKNRDNGTIENFQSSITRLEEIGYEFVLSGV